MKVLFLSLLPSFSADVHFCHKLTEAHLALWDSTSKKSKHEQWCVYCPCKGWRCYKARYITSFCQANRISLCRINYCKCILMSGLRRHCRRSSTAMYWNKNKILLVNADTTIYSFYLPLFVQLNYPTAWQTFTNNIEIFYKWSSAQRLDSGRKSTSEALISKLQLKCLIFRKQPFPGIWDIKWDCVIFTFLLLFFAKFNNVKHFYWLRCYSVRRKAWPVA